MTPKSHGLLRRLSRTVWTVSAAGVCALAVAMWAGHQWIEESVLEDSLERELDFVLERDVPPEDINPRGGRLQYFRPAQSEAWRVPVEVTGLAPGSYHEVRIGDRRFQVQVREIGPGDRAYLVYDIEDLERREWLVFAALAGGIAAILLLVALVSERVAASGLKPLRQLVADIARLDPERRAQRVTDEGGDPDLQPIVQTLNAYLLELDRVLERERAFAAAASHELRTPLAVIASAAELHAVDPAAATVACAQIERAVGEAAGMLDALLLLSQSREAGAAETVPLQPLLSGVRDSFREEAARRQIRLEWRPEAQAAWTGHRGVATVIVGNLLRNALAATPGGTVCLRLEADSVSVEDDGPGLDPGLAERAFEHGVSGRAGGSGLGLYIARTLARRYGGDLRLQPAGARGVRAVWMLSGGALTSH